MAVTITRLNAAGLGIGDDGRAYPRTLPGEVIDAGSGSARIETPVPERVSPPCRHFKSCGGCALQHGADAFVADWKTSVIEAGLAARGLTTTMRQIQTSPPHARRRAVLHGKRTKSGAMIGFHARASDLLIDVPDCQLLHPKIKDAFPALEALTVLAASRKGELDLAICTSKNGLDLDIRGAKPVDPGMITSIAHVAETFGFARIAVEGDVIALRAPPLQMFGTIGVVPPPGAFLQATQHGQDALIAAVQEAVGPSERVTDLFAGCGTFALPLSRTAEVWALEGAEDLIEALDHAWRQAEGTHMLKSTRRDLFRRPVLAQELKGYEAAIIDPPRAGAEAQHIELAASAIKRVAAVSCNPVTFARDAEILVRAGFRLDWVQPVDQFRWSSHIELAAQFTRDHIEQNAAKKSIP